MKTKIYEVEGPDGRIYEIEGPEGASDADITTAAYQHYKTLAQPEPEKPQAKAGLLRRAGDLGISAIQGAIGLPESFVGLADIPTGGRVGKALEGVGYKPEEAKQILQSYKSPEQQAAEQAVAEAEGFTGTIAAGVQNPSAIANTIIQSAPSILGGGALAQGARRLAPSLGAVGAAGIGEGAISAGASAEGVRQQTESGLLSPEQAGISAASGALTGVLGGFGGKVAAKLGVGDIDTILAGGVAKGDAGGLLKSAIKSALVESTVEELPQSMQEQIANNLSLGKPWDQGVAEAGAMGVLAAFPLGAGAGMVSQRAAAREQGEQDKLIKAEQQRIARSKQEAAGAGKYTDAIQYAAEERQADVAGADAVTAQYRELQDELTAKQAKIQQRAEELAPELEKVSKDIALSAGKTNSTTGIQDLLQNFDDYFYFAKKSDADSLRKELQKQLIQTKQAETTEKALVKEAKKAKKLPDTSAEDRGFAETFGKLDLQNYIDDRLTTELPAGVETATTNDLKQLKQDLMVEQASPKLAKKQIPYLDAYESRLDELLAIKAEEDAQRKPELPLVSTAAPAPNTLLKSMVAQVAPSESIDIAQEPDYVEPTIRGVSDLERISETDGDGTVGSTTVPSQRETPPAADIKTAGPQPLGDVSRVVRRPAARTGSSPQTETSTLTPEKTIEKSLIEDFKEAQQNEDLYDDDVITYDDLPTSDYDVNDQYFESKARSKNAPKEVKEKRLKEPSTTMTTTDRMNNAMKGLFNPVWYSRAIKSGWVNVVDGTIDNSNLPDEVKAAHQDAKALFTPDGNVYFFTAKIPKGNETGVILHEIGEHKGLENLIGKDRVKQLANRVRTMASGKGLDANIAQRAIEMSAGEKAEDKELIAYFVEIAAENGYKPGKTAKPELGKAVGWLNDLWSAISNALKKLSIDPNKVNGQDLVDLLYGAARLEMGADRGVVDAETAADDAILEAKARNPELVLDPNTEDYLRNQGLTVFKTQQEATMGEKMLNNMGVTEGWQAWRDKVGNSVFGPLYTITRKANAFYGAEQFYANNSGKLLGSAVSQHALNANNQTFDAMKHGTLAIDDRGFISTVDAPDNIQKLNAEYKNLLNVMMADGMDMALANQHATRMILAERYNQLIYRGVKSRKEFTKEDSAVAEEMKQRYANEFDAWRDTYNRMRANKRQFLLDSGLFTEKKIDELLDRMEYVPLYRMKDSEGMDGAFMQNLLSAKSDQKLVQGTEDIAVGDLMTNIAKNEMWLYKRGIFNHTTNLMVDQVEEMGGGKHLKVRPPNAENVISYLRNGEMKHFKFDDPNDMAMFISQPVINNWVVNQLRTLGGVLRKTITLTPSFIYRQVWQDVERGWLQSGTNQPFYKMLGTSIKEQASNFKKGSESETARALRKRGVIGAIEYQDSFDNAMDELLGREPQSVFEKAYKALERMERLAQNSDMAARATVYEAALKEGATEGEAALRAQMMLNYQHRGTSPVLRALLTTIPFINTKLQSDWRLIDALQGNVPGVSKDKARTLLAMKVGKLALFTVAYALSRSGDDDYEDATEENRNRNFLFMVGDVPLRIPVAPEYLAIKASMEQLTRQAMGNEFATDKKLMHAVGTGLASLLLSPTDVMPSAVRPLLENMTNYSFFQDRALVGPGLSNKMTNEQYVKGQTSELAKWLSDFGQDMLGNELNVSPIKIDNLLRGMFGTFGQDVAFATNQLDAAITGKERAELKLNQMPEIGTAFYDPEGGQRKADYYDLRDKVDRRYNTYLDIRKTDPQRANQFRQENMQYLRLRPQLESIGTQLTNLRARKNRIVEDQDMSGDDKRKALDGLVAQEKRILGTRIQKMLEGME